MGIVKKIRIAFSKRMSLPEECWHDVLLSKWVKEQLEAIPVGKTILDVGAGEQQYRKYCAHLDYKSQDFCQYSGSGDGSGLQMGQWDTSKIDIVSDITDIPVEQESFDAVLCTEVFEHVPEPEKALAEIYRILKKGGVLILTAPFMSETHFAPYHFCSGFDRYWYSYHLKKLGFKEYKITPYGNLFSNFLTSLNIVINSKSVKTSDKLLGLLFRKAFSKYAINDKDNSYEIACYGWNVVATK